MKDYQKSLNLLIDGFGSDKADDLVWIESQKTGEDTFDSAKKDLQELVDKEKPMKVDAHYESDGTEDGSVEIAECPKCGKEIWNDCSCYDKPVYCPECGQRLDWEDSQCLK